MHLCAVVSFGRVLVTAAALLLFAEAGRAEPIKVYPANPHYFMRHGRPFVLVTSDHHYGAVIDADFDFARFLDFLAATGMNLTRIYPGAMFEPPDKYVAGNPLGPLPGRQILPWMRSTEAGAHAALAAPGQASLKFDLDRWNPAYFTRLKAFVESLDLTSIARFDGLSEIPSGAFASALATSGKQYAVYLFHAKDDGQWGAHFVAAPGTYRDTFTLKAIPAGRYRLEWVDPVSGAVKESKRLNWRGGDLRVTTPAYTLDVALRMRAT